MTECSIILTVKLQFVEFTLMKVLFCFMSVFGMKMTWFLPVCRSQTVQEAEGLLDD